VLALNQGIGRSLRNRVRGSFRVQSSRSLFITPPEIDADDWYKHKRDKQAGWCVV